MLVPLREYAERHGRKEVSARQMAQRGGFKSAHKIANNWVIDEDEPYPDHRTRTGRPVSEERS